MRELLKNKNAIWVEGGNTFYLLKAIRESGFEVVVKDLIEKGVIYIPTLTLKKSCVILHNQKGLGNRS